MNIITIVSHAVFQKKIIHCLIFRNVLFFIYGKNIWKKQYFNIQKQKLIIVWVILIENYNNKPKCYFRTNYLYLNSMRKLSPTYKTKHVFWKMLYPSACLWVLRVQIKSIMKSLNIQSWIRIQYRYFSMKLIIVIEVNTCEITKIIIVSIYTWRLVYKAFLLNSTYIFLCCVHSRKINGFQISLLYECMYTGSFCFIY